MQRVGAISEQANESRRLILEQRRFEKDMIMNISFQEKVVSYKKRWDETAELMKQTLQDGYNKTQREDAKALYKNALDSQQYYRDGVEMLFNGISSGEVSTTAGANDILNKFKDHTYQLDKVAQEIAALAKQVSTQSKQNIEQLYLTMTLLIVISSSLFILLSVVLSVLITRSIVKPLTEALNMTALVAKGDLTQTREAEGRDETAQLLNEMNNANTSLSQMIMSLASSSRKVLEGSRNIYEGSVALSGRTEEQASALQETAASLEEMTSSAQNASLSTAKAKDLAEEAVLFARDGGNDVEQSIALMKELTGSSNKIAEIITQLDAITFQTNLLALNASVEAARAGEHGRGFAVVASEVRSLASRSSSSSAEIRALIQDIVGKIRKGSEQAGNTGLSINKTIEAIQNLSVLVSEVSAASEEQHAGIGQINIAINQLDSATQQNAQLVEESQSYAQELENQAAVMKELVARFKV